MTLPSSGSPTMRIVEFTLERPMSGAVPLMKAVCHKENVS
jgi:hypothetical protein